MKRWCWCWCLALAACSPFDASGAKGNDVSQDAGLAADASDAAPATDAAWAGVTLRDTTSASVYDQTSINIPIPGGTQPGDVLVAFLDLGDATTRTKLDGTPAGWSTRVSAAGTNDETFTYVFSRTAVGGEETFTATAASTFTGVGWLFAFSGANNDVVATQRSFNHPDTSIETDSLAIAPRDGDALLVGFVGFNDARDPIDWEVPTGFTLVSRQMRETRAGMVALSSAIPTLGPGPFTTAVPKSPVIAFATATAIVVRRR